MTDVEAIATAPAYAETVTDSVPPRRIGARLAGTGWSVVAWIAGLAFFLPVLWMLLTALKPEASAYTNPPKFFFAPTLSEFRSVFDRGIGTPMKNSAIATIASTVLVLLLALPAAYGLALRPVDKWRDVMFFFISTKMLPIVAAIVPLYVIANDVHLLDHILVLILLYASMNLPLAVWMLRSFLLEVPSELLEAARLDGAGLGREITEVMLPIVAPGVAATGLICVIFAWNEFFLAVNLTSISAVTMPVFLSSFVTSEGLFWARLSAAATIASVPVILIGWVAQRQLVRGLSMGALK